VRRPWDAVAWWEIRRIPYNLALLVVGVVSIYSMEVIGNHLVKPGEDLAEPIGMLIGIIIYAVMANICYSLGWITELVWSAGDTTKTEMRRQKVFQLGLIFSIGLTLMPAVVIFLVWASSGFK
jgi:hypothetical protein